MEKLLVYHFHNGGGGGVLSVIKNLLRFSNNPNIENHIIYTINKSLLSNFIIEPIEGAVTQQIFYYSGNNNFYYTCKQLSKLLPNDKVVIVAHDWIELAMASNLGLQNPVVQILHGDFDYYYELAKRNQHNIDAFICISPTIYKKLQFQLNLRAKSIFYLNFPVPDIVYKKIANDNLKIIYVVRNLTDHRKQFPIIIEIAKKLIASKNKYFFTIIGDGYTQQSFFEIWPTSLKDRVSYLGALPNSAILNLLPEQDIILLPSLSEGLPVSIVEAMKGGVVPLVTNWDGATNNLIIDEFSGYYLNLGDVGGYSRLIKKLQNNRDLLITISNNCVANANQYFNPILNTIKFEEIFKEYYFKSTNLKKSQKQYGSRLDQIWLPNKIVLFIRTLLKSYNCQPIKV